MRLRKLGWVSAVNKLKCKLVTEIHEDDYIGETGSSWFMCEGKIYFTNNNYLSIKVSRNGERKDMDGEYKCNV